MLYTRNVVEPVDLCLRQRDVTALNPVECGFLLHRECKRNGGKGGSPKENLEWLHCPDRFDVEDWIDVYFEESKEVQMDGLFGGGLEE